MLLGNFLLAALFVKLMLEPCNSLNPTWVATGFELASAEEEDGTTEGALDILLMSFPNELYSVGLSGSSSLK